MVQAVQYSLLFCNSRDCPWLLALHLFFFVKDFGYVCISSSWIFFCGYTRVVPKMIVVCTDTRRRRSDICACGIDKRVLCVANTRD